MKTLKKYLVLFCSLLMLIPSSNVAASPDYLWVSFNFSDMSALLEEHPTYTDAYLLFPVLPINKTKACIEYEKANGTRDIKYCEELYCYKISAYSLVPYYDTTPYMTNGNLDCYVSLGNRTPYSIEPYTNDNWKKTIMTNSTSERELHYECKSKKGKDLLIRDASKLYNATNIRAYQLVEDKYVICISVTIGTQDNVDYGDMNEKEYYTGLLKELSDEIALVKIPFNSTQEEFDAKTATVNTDGFSWQHINESRKDSTDDVSTEQSVIEKSEERFCSELVEVSVIEKSAESVVSPFVSEPSISPDPKEPKGEKKNTTYIVIGVVVFISVCSVVVLGLCNKQKKRR